MANQSFAGRPTLRIFHCQLFGDVLENFDLFVKLKFRVTVTQGPAPNVRGKGT